MKRPRKLALRNETPISNEYSAERGHAPAYTSLIMMSDQKGMQAEGIRALRTHLLAQHVQLGRRAFAVCSAEAGAGKTFIAANLAIAFAQVGIKVALVDADFRSNAIQDYFTAFEPDATLQKFLQTDTASFGDAITADLHPNLSLIFAGPPIAHQQEIVGGSRFKQLIDFCLREYELTIVDTPAANASADARRIGTLVSYSLIVAAKNSTRLADLQALLHQIIGDHGQAIGTVLNRA